MKKDFYDGVLSLGHKFGGAYLPVYGRQGDSTYAFGIWETYFFVGNNYYLKLQVMQYFFFIVGIASKIHRWYVILSRNE